jgi:hypothetical protein
MRRRADPALSSCRWLITAAFVLIASPVVAQTGAPPTSPPTVAFCDLVSNPRAFDGQWIQVRGEVSLAFEHFSLREQGCEKPLTKNVWLMYGGDEETPITFCCGDHSQLKGKDIVVRGHAVSLIRNAPMEDFIAKVRARRKRQVNGEPCREFLCNLYDVSANIVGLFLAAPNNPRNPMSGFGHLGCCHLLVIHKVSDVTAERTPVPDDEGNFTCSKQSWEAEFSMPENSMMDRQALNRRFLAQQLRQHGDAELIEVMQNTLSRYAGIDGRLVWTSPDLLTTYSIPYPQSTQPKKGKKAPLAPRSGLTTVTRERCVPMPDTRTP